MPANTAAPLVSSVVHAPGRSLAYPLGLVMGLALPLFAALIYPTYHLSVTPDWLEMTRQLGLPSVFGEIGLIAYAKRRGFDPGDALRRLDRSTCWALALFLGTFWISSVFVAWVASFSTALCLVWVIHLYTAMAVVHLVEASGFTARDFAPGFVLGLAALAVIVTVHLGLPPTGAGPSTWKFGAPIPGFISIRLFGAWAGAALALLLGVAWNNQEGPRWLYLAIGLAAAVVAWTGTRAALFGLIVALGAVASMTRGGAAPGFWRKTATAMVVGTVLGMLMPLENGAGSLLFRENALSSADGFASGRLELWAKSLAVFTQRPLLGHGMGSSWWLISLGGHYHVQPHNALVQFLLNWGIVPTLPALFLLGKGIWWAHRAARRRAELVGLVMMLDFLLAVGLLDGMLHFAQFVMLIAVLIGACLAQPEADARPAS